MSNDTAEPIDDMVFKIKADFLKALANPIRLEIIEYLKNKEASVNQIVQALGVEQSNLSRHLATLREIGILRARQEKTAVFYNIYDQDVFKVLGSITEILKNKFKKSEKILMQLGKK